MLVADVDLAHRAEKDRARDRDARRRLGDAIVGRLHVIGGEVGAVVELHVLAQEERVGLTVLGDLPAVGEIGNDGLAAVARVAADEVVEHAALAAEIVDGARLMHVEMRRAAGDAVAQHAATLGIGLRCGKLELAAIELGGDVRQRVVRSQTPGGCRGSGAPLQCRLQNLTPVPLETPYPPFSHAVSSTFCIFCYAQALRGYRLHRPVAPEDYTPFLRESRCGPG